MEQNKSIYIYRFLHVYENPGRYTVKITGNTYYCFRTAEQGVINSIVSKVLTSELPIASCVTNIASGFTTNTRLQKLEVPKYCNLSHLVNITAAFSSCNNLLTVSGLSYNFGEGTYTTNGLFSGCSNLSSSDFKIPKSTFISSGVAGIYKDNKNLAINVVKLLPDNGFSDKYIDVTNLFQSCSSLSCNNYEKIANILWNDTSKIWLNTSNCFAGCTSLDLTKIPDSWGGTNKEIGVQLQLRKLNVDTNYYSAFEVYPTDNDIAAGDVDDVTGLEYKRAVTQEMRCGLILKGNCPKSECNIVIDWGDGKVYDIKNMKTASSKLGTTTTVDSLYVSGPDSKGEYEYQIVHVYEESSRYIVKIYGNTYNTIRTTNLLGKSIVSRALSYDLPIASCVTNLASFCTTSPKLQKLEIPRYANLKHLINMSSAFSETKNLITVTGLSNAFSEGLASVNGMFGVCENLVSCDFIAPKSTMLGSGVARLYWGCKNLSGDILSLLPANGFSDRYINVEWMFKGCTGLTCDDYEKLANILWNDTSKVWLKTSECFANCSYELRKNVPVSWGGTTPYLTFTAEEAGAKLSLQSNNGPAVKLETSPTGEEGTWTPYTVGTEITLENIGDTVMFRNSSNKI